MLPTLIRIFLVHHWMLAVTRGLCSIALAISLKTMIGYYFYGLDQYHWLNDVAMALSTAICLFCVTLAVFFLSLVADKLLIDKLESTREDIHGKSQQPSTT